MALLKEMVIESIVRLHDESTIEDIMYRLYVIDKVVAKGLEDVKSASK